LGADRPSKRQPEIVIGAVGGKSQTTWGRHSRRVKLAAQSGDLQRAVAMPQFPMLELPAAVTEAPLAGLEAATGLVSRRGRAIADLWRAAAAARQPTELLGLQLGYWTQLLDDYGQALTESVAAFAAEPPQAAVFLPAVVEAKPEAHAEAA
jgi:hypothetical protein